MNKKIIVINGGAGVGKDTFVDFCRELKKVVNVSAVDKVKEAANILIDWDEVKNEKYRKLLADLKQLSIDYNDAPTKYMKKKAQEFLDSDNELMFLHIRETDEIDKIKKELSVKTLLISNPRVKMITSNKSDALVNNYKYDYHIMNTGTLEDLKNSAKSFIESLD